MALYRIPRLVSTSFFIAPMLLCQTGLRINEARPNIVSVHELSHRVPRAAQAEMNKANKARLKQGCDDAVEHLRNAVRIDPDYVAARNNLATCLMDTDPVSAAAELEKAIEIDPHHAMLFHNLALAYLVSNKLEAAERAARNALNLDGILTRSRVVLGIVLVQEQKYTAEALAYLESGRQEYPIAGMFSALVLMDQGQWSRARLGIDTYLSSEDPSYRSHAERWLREIDQRLAASGAAFPSPPVAERE